MKASHSLLTLPFSVICISWEVLLIVAAKWVDTSL
jgi:hypothetical protein